MKLRKYFQETIHLIGYPGTIFMNILKMLIIPLIVASLVSGTHIFLEFIVIQTF